MKKLLFIPLCLFPFISKSQATQSIKLPIDSQTKKITYSEKVFIKGANTSALYDEAEIWFDKTFNNFTASDVNSNYKRDQGLITAKNYTQIHVLSPNSGKDTKRLINYTVTMTIKDGIVIFKMADFYFSSSVAFWAKDSSIESIYKKNSQDGTTRQYYYKLDSTAKVYEASFQNFISPYVTNSVFKEGRSGTETNKYIEPITIPATSGNELIKAANHFYTGLGLSIGGGVIYELGTIGFKPIAVTSAPTNSGYPYYYTIPGTTTYNTNPGLIAFDIIGGVIGIIGTIYMIESVSHIRKAGHLLNAKPSH